MADRHFLGREVGHVSPRNRYRADPPPFLPSPTRVRPAIVPEASNKTYITNRPMYQVRL